MNILYPICYCIIYLYNHANELFVCVCVCVCVVVCVCVGVCVCVCVSSADVARRLGKAAAAFDLMRRVFLDRNLSIATKRHLYDVCVLSTLLYACECWTPLKRDMVAINNFHHRSLRFILGVSRLDQQLQHVNNQELRRRWGDMALPSDTVRHRRLQWLGHVARMPDNRLPKLILFSFFSDPRPACGPRLRWKDLVARDLRFGGIVNWLTLAQDRPAWREAIAKTPDDLVECNNNKVTCKVCNRSFTARGIHRHKCSAVRSLPVAQQPGARHCGVCDRWFQSAGGFAVHRCVERQTSDEIPAVSTRCSLNLDCCQHHCSICDRCMKSQAGFNRHNCTRGKRLRKDQRTNLPIQCSICNERFSRPQDLTRHRRQKH